MKVTTDSIIPKTLKILPRSLAGIDFETMLLIAMAFVDTNKSIVTPVKNIKVVVANACK